MSGATDLDRMIAKIKKIPELTEETAPECAASLDAAIRAELSLGRGPNGEAWPAKKDGGRPLANAAQNGVVTRSVGTTLITRATDPYWAHHRGTKHVPQRRIVPSKLTPNLSEAVRRPLAEAFNRTVRK